MNMSQQHSAINNVIIDTQSVDNLFNRYDLSVNKSIDKIKKGDFSSFKNIKGFNILGINTKSIGAITDGNSILTSKVSASKNLNAELLSKSVAKTQDEWDDNLEILKTLEFNGALEYSFDYHYADIIGESQHLEDALKVKLTSSAYYGIQLLNALKAVTMDKHLAVFKIIVDQLFFIKSDAKKNIIAKIVMTVGLAANTQTSDRIDTNFYNSVRFVNKNCDDICKFICDKLFGLNN